jgi:phosphoserine phosphatase
VVAAQGRRLADFRESTFYSDSHNDLPLLERVTRPVAVDPDDELLHAAKERRWEVISLRR